MLQGISITWFDLVGIAGATLVLLAYLKISTGSWSDGHVQYHLSNLFGSGLILISLSTAFNYAALLLQIVWISVALFGIYRKWQTARQ